VVFGVSADSPADQKKFKEKFDLPYALLSDPDKKLAAEMGVLREKNMYGKMVMGIVRTTFLIGPDGTITHVFENVKPDGHAEEVLAYAKSTVR
jgi:peroxiredoxin Q/BCP